MARRHEASHRFDEARKLQEECLLIRQELVKLQPANLEFQVGVGATHNALADVVKECSLPVAERVKLAIEHYEQAMEVMERLVRLNPAVLHYRRELANIPQD